jgi:hypothetical protein
MTPPMAHLANAFKQAMTLREQMREDGATEAQCAVALEKIIRANWPIRPESEWPEQYRQPRCGACDGYGLVIKSVVNRLGVQVEEGTPCSCYAGLKFLDKSKADQDFTQAGKTSKPKGFTRWSER